MSQDLEKTNLLIEKCQAELSGFSTGPQNYFIKIKDSFNNLFIECDRLNLEIFKSSLVELYHCLTSLDEALSRLAYTDPDLLEEAKLFIGGAFQDIRFYLADLEKNPDSKTLKEKNHQKLTLLMDWTGELIISLPPEIHNPPEESHLERFIILEMGGERFGIFEKRVNEILHLTSEELTPIEDDNFSHIVSHRNQKIFVFDRKKLLGEEFEPPDTGTKTILVAPRGDFLIGIEVDKILKIQELDTASFTNIEDLTGPNYQGSIGFVTLLEDSPLLVFAMKEHEYIEDIIPFHLLGDAR